MPQPPEIYPYVLSDTKDGLHVFAKLDKDSLKLTEAFTIIVGFKNVGTSPLIIYKNMGWGALASLFLTAREQNGKELSPIFISEVRDRPPLLKQDFITLQPGETFTIKSFSSPETLGIEKAGDYRLSVSYESPVKKESVPRDVNVWTQEKGTLYTKDVSFKVIEK